MIYSGIEWFFENKIYDYSFENEFIKLKRNSSYTPSAAENIVKRINREIEEIFGEYIEDSNFKPHHFEKPVYKKNGKIHYYTYSLKNFSMKEYIDKNSSHDDAYLENYVERENTWKTDDARGEYRIKFKTSYSPSFAFGEITIHRKSNNSPFYQFSLIGSSSVANYFVK